MVVRGCLVEVFECGELGYVMERVEWGVVGGVMDWGS